MMMIISSNWHHAAIVAKKTKNLALTAFLAKKSLHQKREFQDSYNFATKQRECIWYDFSARELHLLVLSSAICTSAKSSVLLALLVLVEHC